MWSARTSSASVVIVDDDETILDAVELVLRELSWGVRTYASGEAFLADIPNHPPPDCLILDPHLRGMSGDAVARAMSTDYQQVPIIALTAQPSSPVIAAVIGAGVRAILTKPVSVETLIDEIEVAMEAARSQ